MPILFWTLLGALTPLVIRFAVDVAADLREQRRVRAERASLADDIAYWLHGNDRPSTVSRAARRTAA